MEYPAVEMPVCVFQWFLSHKRVLIYIEYDAGSFGAGVRVRFNDALDGRGRDAIFRLKRPDERRYLRQCLLRYINIIGCIIDNSSAFGLLAKASR